MKEKEKIVYKKYHYLIILFLTALSAAMMYPMIWTILTSFKSNAEIRINRTKFFPEEWTIEGTSPHLRRRRSDSGCSTVYLLRSA